ncbi:hypothetical protein [Tsukamurella spumae]|uniref:Phosphatase PAP2 family protein n=1 Tax=Tsukamurella spumae TaxID=44753 RepID=A0A846X2G3_9ACTN|nr:hypothetical protein [Tsukamurella spumae]NKY19504.1 hypothetical protein [Tsukamurella spumae]
MAETTDAATQSTPNLLARLVTEASAPWLVNVLAALAVGSMSGAPAWGAFAAFIAGLGPILGILMLMRLGRATDHHVGDRRHRGLVLGMIVIIMTLGVGLEVLWRAPAAIVTLSVAGLVTIVAVGVVTSICRYKISVHTAVWAGTTLLLAALIGTLWLLAALALPLVGWARVRVRDHTVGQTVTGALLGLATVVATLGALQ